MCVCPAPCACARCVCPGRASDVTLSRRSSRSPGAPPGEISPLLASPHGVLGMYVGFLRTPLPWGAGLGHALPLSSRLPLSQAPPNSHNIAGGRTGGSPRAPPSFQGGQLSLTSPLSLLLSSSLTCYRFHQSLPQTFNYSINGRPYIFQGSVSLGKRQYRVHRGQAAGRTLKP